MNYHHVSPKATSIVLCEKVPPSSSLITTSAFPRKANLINAILWLETPNVWQVSNHFRFKILAQEVE